MTENATAPHRHEHSNFIFLPPFGSSEVDSAAPFVACTGVEAADTECCAAGGGASAALASGLECLASVAVEAAAIGLMKAVHNRTEQRLLETQVIRWRTKRSFSISFSQSLHYK